MKLFNKLTAAMLSVALMAGVSSCTEVAEYEAPQVPNNAQVYFPNTASSTISLNNEQDSFVVKVTRAVAGGELIVPISAASDSVDVFTFPENVVFAADSLTADVVVKFDFANIIPDTDYPVSIELLGDDTTPYGASAVNVVVKYAPWTEWEVFGTGTYTLSLMWSGTLSGVKVYARESALDPTKKQFTFGAYPDYEMLINYDATTGLCTIGEHFTGYNHSSYGPVYVSDVNTYAGEEVAPSYFEPEKGLFSLYLIYYVSAGYFGNGYEYLQLDGYTQPDYSLKMEEKGHYITPDGTDNALVYIYKGADAFSYKYAITSGALDEEGLNAMVGGIIEGTVESVESEESGYHLFPLTEAGPYTVVAVSFDKAGEAMSANYLTFEFAPAGQPSPWESLGTATYREDIVANLFEGAENIVYEVEIQQNTETPGLYRLVNPYAPAMGYYGQVATYDDSKNYYMVIDATDPTKVDLELSEIGMDVGAGMISVWSMAQYMLANGKSEEDVAALYGKLEDGVITFPGQALVTVMGGKLYYGNSNGKFAVALPGVELPEDEATEEGGEEGGEESSARVRRTEDAKPFAKYVVKGRPVSNSVIANYIQSNLR